MLFMNAQITDRVMKCVSPTLKWMFSETVPWTQPAMKIKINYILTLTADVHFISDAVCSLATTLLNDGPGALSPFKVWDSHFKPSILDICNVPLFVDLMKVISCLFVELEGGCIILLDPLTGVSTGEVGSVGQGRAQPLLTSISWKRKHLVKQNFDTTCYTFWCFHTR